VAAVLASAATACLVVAATTAVAASFLAVAVAAVVKTAAFLAIAAVATAAAAFFAVAAPAPAAAALAVVAPLLPAARAAATATRIAILPLLVATTAVVARWVGFAHAPPSYAVDAFARMTAVAAVTTAVLVAVAPPVAAATKWFVAPRTASFAGTVVLVGGVAVVHVSPISFPFLSAVCCTFYPVCTLGALYDSTEKREKHMYLAVF